MAPFCFAIIRTRFRVTLEYDGTDLIGWQENRQGPSVQSVLRDAIYAFCGVRPDVVAAGNPVFLSGFWPDTGWRENW